MKPLLKITTKPMRISVVRQVEKPPIQTQVNKHVATKPFKTNDQLRLSQPVTGVKELEKSTDVRNTPLNKDLTSSSLILQKIANDEVNVNVFIPQASAAKYEPEYLLEPHDFDAKVLKYKVDQYNEIRFEYTGDFIYVPIRSETTHEE